MAHEWCSACLFVASRRPLRACLLTSGAVGPKRRSASVSNAARGSRAARSVRVLAVAAPPPDVRETNGASTAVWSINYDASKVSCSLRGACQLPYAPRLCARGKVVAQPPERQLASASR